LVAAFSQLPDSISQDIATVVGYTYRVSFWLSNQVSPGTPNSMLANFGEGSPLIPGELPATMPWTQYTFDVIASTSMTTLSFTGGANAPSAVLLDDVVVEVVPEPAVYGILVAVG